MQVAADETRVEFVARWSDELKKLRATLTATDPSPSPAQFDELSSSMQELKQVLSQNVDWIPVFELGRCERELKTAQQTLSKARGELSTAKPKFSFRKTESKSAAPKLPQPTSNQTPAPPPSADSRRRKLPNIPSTSLTLSSKKDCYLCSQDLPSASESQALLLSDLQNSFVDLSSSPPTSFSALYLYGLRRSCIIVPPILGSIMAHDCHGCIFFLGSHQFRMHDSTDTKIMLHVTSQPVIERCRGLRFGPYPFDELNIPTIENGKSLYDQVQDFDSPFASAETPSENFSLVDPDTGWRELRDDARWSDAVSRKENWKEALQSTLAC
ncbi:BQ2448_4116 [Microbotryum intermedium]|uniref:BQ2448_4116 protein n=1 Tax=Microbotryum intermedium TaxID=269621 RepID=A0A238FIG3_9BASI|nr:BQ2448_4116 [Microbotryum intermedium]